MAAVHIDEFDEAGSLVSSYIETEGSKKSRIDVVRPSSKSLWAQLLDIFLPAGFPNSVTDDYVEYQLYDSLQAFASTIAGLLSSRAVLEGVGVGDATASPTAALLLSIIQESTGRLATIAFAHRLGTTFEPECKRYRLAADVLNDVAMILDCLSPAFPKPIRVAVFSASSTLRALCGVAAGSSKASLSAHFARWGNLGELNAKDSSQETVISLLGMLVGSFIVSRIKSLTATWSTLLLLLGIHLYTNYAAVRAVQMRTLNRQRANIVFSHLIETGVVLTPREVSRRERIFERDGVLRWGQSQAIGYGLIGVGMQPMLKTISHQQIGSGSFTDVQARISEWQRVFDESQYLLWFDVRMRVAFMMLKKGASTRGLLEAWMHGLLVAKDTKTSSTEEFNLLERLHESRLRIVDVFERHSASLKDAGWDMDTTALETQSGMRLQVMSRSR